MKETSCKLLIVGAGPAGYVCAIRAAQKGVDTILVEERQPGGTCLNVGCIPSKAIIHAANLFHEMASNAGDSALGIKAGQPTIAFDKTLQWKNGIVDRLTSGVSALIKKAGAQLILGRAQIIDGKTVDVQDTGTGEQVRIKTETLVLATGSEPLEIPSLPFGGPVISSTQALALDTVPRSLCIVGGGYIGLELGTAFAKLGSQVTVVEASTHILPQYDQPLTGPVAKSLQALGVNVRTSSRAIGTTPSRLTVEDENGDVFSVDAEKVLVTVGRRARTNEAGIPSLDLAMNELGHITVDNQCRTSMRGVYAIGDITGDPMLAHRGMAQGELVADIVAGEANHWDRRSIPAVCFTDPEIVSCGLSPDAAKADGYNVQTGQFPFIASGRAMTMEAEDTGFVRAVVDADTGLVLGFQALGRDVSELSGLFSAAIEMGAVVDDMAGIMQAHPTLSEAVQEACLLAVGKGLHL